jgi:aromatic-L-amino-acid/L-tryptophan decarboxylase
MDDSTGRHRGEDVKGRDAMVPDRETMRELGYRAVDHVVERWLGLEDARPWRTATRAETEALLGGPAPEEGEPVEALMDEAVGKVFPLAGSIDHPRFFAFVPSAPVWPAVLADILVSGHNVFQGTWLESAGPSQVELTVLDWFRDWLGMPEGAGGILTSGGSVANLLALATAREAAGWPDDPVVYLSDQGHSSLRKAARVVGFRPPQIRILSTGSDFRLRPETVRRALEEDRARGRTPVAVCANGGATNTGAVDPLGELAAACREAGTWLHVDAAYGGFAILDPRGAGELEGLGDADSVTLDPHKWLFQTYECGCLMVRDPADLERTFRLDAEYLQDTETRDGAVNFGDRGVQLTRAFRALKVWMSVRAVGRRVLAEEVGRGIELARRAEERIRESDDLELLHPARLSIVCYRYRPPGDWTEDELERLNARIQDRLLAEGDAMISSTRLRNRYALRLCILSHRSRWSAVERVLSRVEAEGRALSRRREASSG